MWDKKTKKLIDFKTLKIPHYRIAEIRVSLYLEEEDIEGRQGGEGMKQIQKGGKEPGAPRGAKGGIGDVDD